MNTVKTIVAIGGGELRSHETLAIDEYIVKLSGRKNPKALSVLTASGEPDGYTEAFNRVYGDKLGCTTDTLKILTGVATDAELCSKILSADIIYVGGGNTAKMLAAWRSRNVDGYLKEAYSNGTVLSGLSAGSICWFEYGHSDSYIGETGEYRVIDGLGLLPGLNCPHYNERPEFDGFMKTQTATALAVDNNCAVVFQDGFYKVIKSKETANAFLLENLNGEIKKRKIDNPDFKPVADLFPGYKEEPK